MTLSKGIGLYAAFYGYRRVSFKRKLQAELSLFLTFCLKAKIVFQAF